MEHKSSKEDKALFS